MDSNIQLEGGLAKRIFVTGIPSYLINDITSLICRWVRCSGLEYTIKRLKSLKQYLIKGGDVPPGFARNRRGDLKGIFGSLIRWGKLNLKNFGKALQALQSYTYFSFEKPTASQKNKFFDAVSCDKPDNLSHTFHRDFALSLRKHIGVRRIERSEDVSLISYRGSDSRFRPGLGHLFPRSKTSERITDYLTLLKVRSYAGLFRRYGSLFEPVFKGVDREHFCKDNIALSSDLINTSMFWPVYGGEVHYLMQEGGKMRSIASPHLVFQLALRHLGSAIYSVVQSLPWDCTFDQSKAIPFVQYALQQSSTVHSVDLSSATDYFPLSLQLSCLRGIFGDQPDIHLFEEVSRSYWITPSGKAVRWKRGQPLGLYPSFGTFTLTHGALLWYLNGCKHDNQFFVLGDDVVILNDQLYHDYITILNTMSCPWSVEKSISSNKLSEFAGKLITPSSVISMMKYKKLSNDNFLDICRQLGPNSRLLLSRPQRKIFDAVKHLVLPFGLNYSYPGSNYQSMLAETMKIWNPSEAVVASLMGLSSVIRKNIYGKTVIQNLPVDLSGLLAILETFDEKVVKALQTLIPWELWNELQGSPILEGYAGVPSAMGYESLLPLRAVVLRTTTLERYQRILADRVRS